MTLKEQVMQELEQAPDSTLEEVLELLLYLKGREQSQLEQRPAWKAFLSSKQERAEVYRRLANS